MAVAMRLEIIAVSGSAQGEELTVRAAIVNDSFAPVPLSRNAFTGPTLIDAGFGSPPEQNVEATYNQPDEPMTLQPFTLYGRDRTFDLPAGKHRFLAEYRPAGAQAPLRLEAVIDVDEPPDAG
jgi:hypothetical protein